MRRPSGSLVLSLCFHAVLGVVVLRAVLGSGAWLQVPQQASSKPVEETVRYIGLAGRVAPTPVAGREGGNDVPERKRATRPLSVPPAPTSIPSTLPPAPVATAPVEPPAGYGPLVGRGGPLRGIEPAYTDQRVWTDLVNAPSLPKTSKQRVDSVIADRFSQIQDSLRVAQANKGRDPGDWTVEKGGYKWGMDPKFIRLGPVSIPTTLLALLPMNKALQGNVFAAERRRQQDAWSREINEQAQRSLNEDEFRVAVKRLRERKEKERMQRKGERETIAGPSGSE